MKQRYILLGLAFFAVVIVGGLVAIVSQQDTVPPTRSPIPSKLPSPTVAAQTALGTSEEVTTTGTVVTGTVPPQLMLLTLTMEAAISDQLTQSALEYSYQSIQSTARAIISTRQTATATNSTPTPVSTTLLTQTMQLAIYDQLTQVVNENLYQQVQATARGYVNTNLTATATLTSATPIPSETPIPPVELTRTMQAALNIQSTDAALARQYDSLQVTARAGLTATATFFTPTPTLTATPTDPVRLTQTMQAALDIQSTDAALASQYDSLQVTARAGLTATATFFTPTPSYTPTPTYTPLSEQTIQAAVNAQMTQIAVDQTYAAIYETAKATVNTNLTATATNIGPVQQTQTVQAAVNDYFTLTSSARLNPTLTASFQTAVQRGINQALTATAYSAQLTKTATYQPTSTATPTPRYTVTPTLTPTSRFTTAPSTTSTANTTKASRP